MIELKTLCEYFDDSQDASFNARASAEQCRDFYDGNQLDANQKAVLKKRNQPEVVFNMIQPKVDFLCGMERQNRTDPKAFPRTPDHDDAANAATDAIRYVCDNNEFDIISSDGFENLCIEGTEGAAVEARLKGEEIEIAITKLDWNRLFIDPHSMRRDATDARYIGYVSWKDRDEVIARWPGVEKVIDEQMATHHSIADTTDDKPTRWYSANRQRVMCVDICFKHNGTWHNAIYVKGAFLEEPKESTYVDADGVPQCKFIVTSARVDRDGNRYGPVKNDIYKQKEVNARRSKSLHLLNTRQTFGREGAIKDLNAFKREANKPDGHLTYPGSGQFGKDFGVIPNEQLVGPQFEMYMEAKASMDMAGANQALQGTTEKGLSGRAVRSLQAGGMMELAPLFDIHAQWKKQIYRAIWDRVKQYWREEKWIRVTDDEDNLQWVGLNTPLTVAEKMIKDQTGMSLMDIRRQYGDQLQQAYMAQPEMAQLVMDNAVAEMDVDIIIEEVPDVVNLQSEQFELLVQMYQANPQSAENPNGIKWEHVVEMSTLRNKDRILGKDLSPEEQQAAAQEQERAQIAQQVQLATAEADINSKNARAMKDKADAEAQTIENQVVVSGFDNLMQDKLAETAKKMADADMAQSKALQTDVETGLLLTNPQPDKVAVI